MAIDIKVKHVKEFLKQLGYEWDYDYYDEREHRFKKAVQFKDISTVCSLVSFRMKDKKIKDFWINGTHFVEYRTQAKNGRPLYKPVLVQNHSDKWKTFTGIRPSVI